MPGVYLGYVQYGGAAVSLSPGGGRTDYWLHLPLRGHLHAMIDCDSVECDPCCGAIVSPERDNCRLVSEPDSRRIQLAISKSSLLERLGMLLGEPPVAPVDFAPALNLSSGYGRSLAGYVLTAVADLEQAGTVLWSPATMAVFEEFIATALLLSHRHNYCDALNWLDRSIAPRDVRRAIDYIEANLDSPLSIAAHCRSRRRRWPHAPHEFPDFQGRLAVALCAQRPVSTGPGGAGASPARCERHRHCHELGFHAHGSVLSRISPTLWRNALANSQGAASTPRNGAQRAIGWQVRNLAHRPWWVVLRSHAAPAGQTEAAGAVAQT